MLRNKKTTIRKTKLQNPKKHINKIFTNSKLRVHHKSSNFYGNIPNDLSGKTAIVTGGSRGIGNAVIKHLIERGSNIIYCSRDQSSVEASLQRFQQQYTHFQPLKHSKLSPDTTTQASWSTGLLYSSHLPTPQFIQGYTCDVSDEGSIQSFFRAVKGNIPIISEDLLQIVKEKSDASNVNDISEDLLWNTHPKVINPSLLINSAGICQDRLLLRSSQEQINNTLNINVTGTMLMTKYFIRQLAVNNNDTKNQINEDINLNSISDKNSQYFRVIAIGSIIGQRGNAGQASYAASKAAIGGFVKSMSYEMPSFHGVPLTFNAVAPGYIETDMTQHISLEKMQSVLGQVALKRIGKPDEIAKVIGFLSSRDSSYITGQVIGVDGGM